MGRNLVGPLNRNFIQRIRQTGGIQTTTLRFDDAWPTLAKHDGSTSDFELGEAVSKPMMHPAPYEYKVRYSYK